MTPSLKQVWPEPADITPEEMALAALRHEIDLVDDQLLALFQKRLALAARVGRAKDAPAGPHLKLRPDREAAVLERMRARAHPDTLEAVESLWRQIVGWGLARQGRLQVRVWSPVDAARAFDGARLRFGDAAQMRMEQDPQTALAFAAEGGGVAVLAINAGDPWWIGLRREWSALSVFDGFGGETPMALAVGRIDPAALPTRRSVVVDVGGDAGDGAGVRRKGLDTHHGWSLSLVEAPLTVGGAEGCVGAIV